MRAAWGGGRPLRPLRGLQETRVATREESGVLGFPSRRGLTPRVTVSWELGMGSCTTALPPAADPLAQTEGNTTSGESLGPSPTSAQPLLIQSSTSSLYRPPQPEPSSQGHPRISAPDTTDDSSPSPQTHHSGRKAYVLEASWALGKGKNRKRNRSEG